MKVIVVGASTGIGRFTSIKLAKDGNKVALLARSKDKLATAVAEAGSNAFAVRCDVTDEASVKDAIEEAATELGGVDGVIFSTGIGNLIRLSTASQAIWRELFDTNVIGAALVTAAVLPYLEESKGTIVYLSSISAETAPWPGLGGYVVSKAALNKLIEAFRAEHPTIGFTRLVVGDCTGGEGDAQSNFASGWDMELAGEFMPIWVERNLIAGSQVPVEEIARVAEQMLQNGPATMVHSVFVTPRLLT